MGKWFPTLYDTVMKPMEKRGFLDIRKNLIHKAHGIVLEIGSGTGVNFPYYINVDKITAIEPNPFMSERSSTKIKDSHMPIEVITASAERLPFDDNTFDTVVGTLVFCTIPDPQKALSEIRRVCKPEGKLLLFEHVKVNDSLLGTFQEWLTPIWKCICDGCHLDRDSLEFVKQAGFKVTAVKRHYRRIFLVVEAINRKSSSDLE